MREGFLGGVRIVRDKGRVILKVVLALGISIYILLSVSACFFFGISVIFSNDFCLLLP
jgi:hypothetical protein